MMVDIINNNGILEIPENVKYQPRNSKGYGAACFEKMKQFCDKIAQIDTETNETQTYGDILKDTIRCALKMKSLGIGEKDFVSLCTNIHSQVCIPYWAAAFLGTCMAPLDPSLAINDLLFLSNLAKPKLIFCIPESVEALEKVIEENKLNCKLVVFGETDKHLPFSSFIEPQQGENNFEPFTTNDLFDTAIILFSSGTTGLPKAICITHYSILYLLNLIDDYYTLESTLYYTSPYWISYLLLTNSTLFYGGRRVIDKTFDPTKIIKTIQDYKVTYIFLPPSLTYPICNHEENYKYDTSTLITFMVGGSTTPPEQVKKIQKLCPNSNIIQIYGMTEITAFFSAFHPKNPLLKTKLGSSGTMIGGIKCKVVDLETNEIINAPYKKGELLIKSNRLLKEYYKNEKATREAYDDDGFFRTGDVVYYDEDYCFYIVDRIKEMFKYKSWHIIPAELEAILLKHPEVKEAVIIGYPNDEDGDHPMAVIIPKNNKLTEADILKYFNEQVSDRKQLRGGVKFIKNIPKTTTGKYSRRILRDMIINNKI